MVARSKIRDKLSPSYDTLYECGTTQDLSKITKVVIKVTWIFD